MDKVMRGLALLPTELRDLIAEYVDWLYGKYIIIPTVRERRNTKRPRAFTLDVIVFPFYRYLEKPDDEEGYVFPSGRLKGVHR